MSIFHTTIMGFCVFLEKGGGGQLLHVVQPSIEHGSAVWDCNKNQASALEAILLPN